MNDPRLLDYALGELAAPEREAFERELAASTDLQRELHETIALLEAIPPAIIMNETLTDSARKHLRTEAANNLDARRTHRTARRRIYTAGLGALAAGIVATALIVFQHETPEPLPSRGLTANGAPPANPTSPASLSAEIAPSGETTLLAMESLKPLPIDTTSTRFRSGLDAEVKQQGQPSSAAIPGEPGQVSDDVPLVGRLTSKDEKRSDHLESAPASMLVEATGAHPYSDDLAGGSASTAPRQAESQASAAPAEELIDLLSAPTVTAKSGQRAAITLTTGTASRTDSGGFQEGMQTRSFGQSHPLDRFNTEAYDSIAGNAYLAATRNPLSTFSIDVDTASYANVRRFLTDGQLPPPGAVRIEELINYFPYSYPQPAGDAPFSVTTDVTRAPWNEKHLLARIALKGRDIATDKLPASNLVFLIDVSGSMNQPNKLPLLKRSLSALVEKLSPRDRVAIVVYAGSSGLALSSTPGEDKAAILSAIDRLQPGGSTNGAEGIELAYDIARKHFLEEGNNRVILCTDGDFNVGVTNRSELVRLIEEQRKSGVFLSVLGFGTGNMKDSQMEQLANKGNGNYAYIDTASEGRKVLVEQMGATLFTIAKDVKIQVEFNPATVAGYRLIGYENRLLAKEDFNDDTKDAGEIGAGHTVTALYEIVPAGQPLPGARSVDPLKYQQPEIGNRKSEIGNSTTDLFTVKLRSKAHDGDTSKLLEKVVTPEAVEFAQAPTDLRFAAAVAAFGMKLCADKNDASLDWTAIQKIARDSLGEDPGTYRAEFLTLVEKARQLTRGEQ